MKNTIESKLIIDTLDDLFYLLNNNLLEIRFYLSEKLLNDNTIESISHIFNMAVWMIIDWNDGQDKWYSIQTLYIDWVKYYDIEKRNLINEEERKIVLNLLEEEFWESLQSVWVFGSYITKEDWEYSDYDLVVMLNNYENSNIYEREKASPRLKAKLKEAWIQSLFAFNFTTVEELENANEKNPWLLETMWKSFYVLKDSNNKLEDILTWDRGIEYLWNFVWKWESLNTKENLERIDNVLVNNKNILAIATNNNTDFITYYEWEIKKLEIIRKLLEEQYIFVSRFDFDFICKDLLELDDNEVNNLFQMYKNASIEWKKITQSYNSIKNNIDFSEKLKLNDLILPSLQHKYIALRNILSELLHKTWNFILDWEFTQKFLQVFWNSLSDEVRNIFYENIFKIEQILWRTWYLSFDLNADWSYIFEEWNYDYQKLITVLDSLIQYFQENNTVLLNDVWQKETKVSILSWSTELSDSDFLFPNEFKLYNRQEVADWNIPQWLKDSEYIFILDSENDFSPDYLLKVLSGFNKKWIKCVSWNRVSKVRWAKNQFHNFAFKKEDYEKDWKDIFKHSLRNIWTNYFTS